jgi:hypothetical protein
MPQPVGGRPAATGELVADLDPDRTVPSDVHVNEPLWSIGGGPHDLPEGDERAVLDAAEGDGPYRPGRALRDGDRIGAAVAGVGGLRVAVTVARPFGQAGAVGVARPAGPPCR